MLAALLTLFSSQALVVASALAIPVLAPQVAASHAIDARWIGYYAALVYGCAMLAALATPTIVQRCGALRVNQITLLLAAAGLALAPLSWLPLLAFGGLLVGCAYGPGNPSGSSLLIRHTPAALRGRVFSLKQTSVPAGGALAGLALPPLTLWVGWQNAVLALAGLCLITALLMQPWRTRLDNQRQSDARFDWSRLHQPLLTVTKLPALRRLGLMSACFAAIQFTFSAVFVTFQVEQAALDPVRAGFTLSLALLFSVVARFFWGWLADRMRPLTVLALLGGLMMLTCLAAVPVSAHWPFPAMVLLGLAFGITVFSWNGVYLAEVATTAAPDEVAAATSGTMCFTFFGGLAGPAMFTAVVGASGHYAAGFVLLAGFALVATGLLLGRPSPSNRNAANAP